MPALDHLPIGRGIYPKDLGRGGYRMLVVFEELQKKLGEAPRCSEVAMEMGVSRQRIEQLVSMLVARGYLERYGLRGSDLHLRRTKRSYPVIKAGALTVRQRIVLVAFDRLCKAGRNPTLAEIARASDSSDASVVIQVMNRLTIKGYVKPPATSYQHRGWRRTRKPIPEDVS